MFLTGCASNHDSENNDSIVSDSLFHESDNSQNQNNKPKSSILYTESDARLFLDTTPHAADYRAGILPQMLEDATDYAIKLLNSKYERFLVVDKYRMKVIVFNKFGVEQESYKMACAKNYGTKHKKADSRTPEGFFTVHGVYDSTEWLFTDDEGNTSDKKGQFGPRFIRLNIPITSQIGIHGTCAPWSLGGRSSHGCIRIHNDNIMKLIELVDSGMPVIITPGLKDMEVNHREGYAIKSISTIPGKKAPMLKNGNEDETKPETDSTLIDEEKEIIIQQSDSIEIAD